MRGRILNGEFRDGDALIQEAIAAEYDVSRMPVREAFKELETSGLIASKIHKGSVNAVCGDQSPYGVNQFASLSTGGAETRPCNIAYPGRIKLLADATPVGGQADAWAANTLLANKAGLQVTMGCTTFVAEPDAWDQMAERQRTSEADGLCLGLDAANVVEAFAAGNAVVPQIGEWIARKVIAPIEGPAPLPPSPGRRCQTWRQKRRDMTVRAGGERCQIC